jgi:general secretion pathway protein J
VIRRAQGSGWPTRGFTLVEVVVALSVLSLILLATVTALRTFANTQSTLERHTDRVDEMRAVSSLLRDLVDAAVMGSGSNSGLTLGGTGRGEGFLRGSQQEVAWKTTFMFGENFGGTYLVRLAVIDGDLLLQWQDAPINPVRVDWDDMPSKVLSAGVGQLVLAYRERVGGEWLPGWEGPAMPAQVRIRILAQERFWPDLVIGVLR